MSHPPPRASHHPTHIRTEQRADTDWLQAGRGMSATGLPSFLTCFLSSSSINTEGSNSLLFVLTVAVAVRFAMSEHYRETDESDCPVGTEPCPRLAACRWLMTRPALSPHTTNRGQTEVRGQRTEDVPPSESQSVTCITVARHTVTVWLELCDCVTVWLMKDAVLGRSGLSRPTSCSRYDTDQHQPPPHCDTDHTGTMQSPPPHTSQSIGMKLEPVDKVEPRRECNWDPDTDLVQTPLR